MRQSPFPERETSVGSTVCVALTCTVCSEKGFKAVLKIIAYNDPFLYLHAFKNNVFVLVSSGTMQN